MYVPLTDIVTCPRCGPQWGLILLADRVLDRRILSGRFGCPNCRGAFDVDAGFADLRPGPGTAPGAARGAGAQELAAPAVGEAEREAAVRLAALLGLGVGSGPYALVAGPAARLAPALAALVEGLEIVAVGEALRGWPERGGVTRLAAAGRLPFRDGSIHGVALGGEAATTLLEEGARVLAAPARLVIEDAPDDAAVRLERAAIEVVAREGTTVVARRR